MKVRTQALAPSSVTPLRSHKKRTFTRPSASLNTVCPGGPTTIGYYEQLFWAGISTVALLPSAVLPGGRDPSGLPIGLQLIGPYLEDRTCLAAGIALEAEVEGFVAPPLARS